MSYGVVLLMFRRAESLWRFWLQNAFRIWYGSWRPATMIADVLTDEGGVSHVTNEAPTLKATKHHHHSNTLVNSDIVSWKKLDTSRQDVIWQTMSVNRSWCQQASKAKQECRNHDCVAIWVEPVTTSLRSVEFGTTKTLDSISCGEFLLILVVFWWLVVQVVCDINSPLQQCNQWSELPWSLNFWWMFVKWEWWILSALPAAPCCPWFWSSKAPLSEAQLNILNRCQSIVQQACKICLHAPSCNTSCCCGGRCLSFQTLTVSLLICLCQKLHCCFLFCWTIHATPNADPSHQVANLLDQEESRNLAAQNWQPSACAKTKFGALVELIVWLIAVVGVTHLTSETLLGPILHAAPCPASRQPFNLLMIASSLSLLSSQSIFHQFVAS